MSDTTTERCRKARRLLEGSGFAPGKAWKATEDAIESARKAASGNTRAAELDAALAAGDIALADRLAVEIAFDSGAASERVEDAYRRALLERYPWVEGYAFAAEQYGKAGAALTEAVNYCDSDMDPEQMARLGDSKRKMWSVAPDRADTVRRAWDVLLAVAMVAVPRFIATDPAQTLGLAVAVGDKGLPEGVSDPRRLMEVWTAREHRAGVRVMSNSLTPPVTFGRAGRFGELVKMGATLKAPSREAFRRVDIPELVPDVDGKTIDPLTDPELAASVTAFNAKRAAKLRARESAARTMR